MNRNWRQYAFNNSQTIYKERLEGDSAWYFFVFRVPFIDVLLLKCFVKKNLTECVIKCYQFKCLKGYFSYRDVICCYLNDLFTWIGYTLFRIFNWFETKITFSVLFLLLFSMSNSLIDSNTCESHSFYTVNLEWFNFWEKFW